jgi:hypothetical protein
MGTPVSSIRTEISQNLEQQIMKYTRQLRAMLDKQTKFSLYTTKTKSHHKQQQTIFRKPTINILYKYTQLMPSRGENSQI